MGNEEIIDLLILQDAKASSENENIMTTNLFIERVQTIKEHSGGMQHYPSWPE